jgi:hypothetical protein
MAMFSGCTRGQLHGRVAHSPRVDDGSSVAEQVQRLLALVTRYLEVDVDVDVVIYYLLYWGRRHNKRPRRYKKQCNCNINKTKWQQICILQTYYSSAGILETEIQKQQTLKQTSIRASLLSSPFPQQSTCYIFPSALWALMISRWSTNEQMLPSSLHDLSLTGICLGKLRCPQN